MKSVLLSFFLILAVLFTGCKSKEDEISEILEARNQATIVDTLYSLLSQLHNQTSESQSDREETLKLIQNIISFSLKENLANVKNKIETELVSYAVDRRNSSFNPEIVNYSLDRFREYKVKFDSIGGIFNKDQDTLVKDIVSLTDLKSINSEVKKFLTINFDVLKNVDTNGNVDSDTLRLGHISKSVEIWSLLNKLKIELSYELSNSLKSIKDYKDSRTAFTSERIEEPVLPVYTKPEYKGAFYLSGTYIGKFTDQVLGMNVPGGIVLQSGGTYYVISDGEEPRNPFARYLSGYVSGSQTIMIDRGKNGTPAIKVFLSDIETYREDQAAYAQEVKESQEKFAQDMEYYRRSMQYYNESISKITALKKECDRKAKAMIMSFQSLLEKEHYYK